MLRGYFILIKKLLSRPFLLIEIILEILAGRQVTFEIEGDNARIYSEKKKGK